MRLSLRGLEFKGTQAKPEPVAVARGAQVSAKSEPATATQPDPAALVGTWTGTLRAPGRFSSPVNYPAALRVSDEQGRLRWSLDVQGGDFDGKGEVVRSEQGIALSGTLGSRAFSISYAVTMAESTLEAMGIGADNQRYSLAMQKQR